jgi:hypothetical protein
VSAPDSQAGLPRWAKRGDDGMIEVDPDLAYPLYLRLLGVQTLDQFWLEVARRCLTADLKALLGTPLAIRILEGSGRYALAAVAAGGGPALGAATFRTFYARIEGRGLNG